jgi:hypothetical protein
MFPPIRLVGFWWRSMPRGPARNDRKVVNFPRQVSAPPPFEPLHLVLGDEAWSDFAAILDEG